MDPCQSRGCYLFCLENIVPLPMRLDELRLSCLHQASAVGAAAFLSRLPHTSAVGVKALPSCLPYASAVGAAAIPSLLPLWLYVETDV